MADYIEREAALATLCRDCDKIVPPDEREPCRYWFTGCMEYYNIFELAAADVAPVVHGKWCHETDEDWCGGGKTMCSACGYGFSDGAYHEVLEFNFCPNCGADMREVDDG